MAYLVSTRGFCLCFAFCLFVLFFWRMRNGQTHQSYVEHQNIGINVFENNDIEKSFNYTDEDILITKQDIKLSEVTVWISMGLCLSTNTKFYGKRNFPYKEAAVLSSKLWKTINFEYKIRVIIHIAYSIFNDKPLEGFISKLKQDGVTTVPIQTTPDECVLVAQTSRLFAYRNKLVKADDIIITSDVDAFPSTPALLNPLKDKLPINVWQHGYVEKANVDSTFPMCFISMTKSLWASIMDCSDPIPTCIRPYHKLARNMWGVDQALITYKLLSLKRCSVNNPKAWKGVGLQPQPFNDAKTCGHYNLRNNHVFPRSYTWVHFKPTETVDAITKAFNDIIKKNT